MGNCNRIVPSHVHGDATAVEACITLPGPDTSSMDLEQLLRQGIAEAQRATVARVKRDRVLHLHRARALLIEALKRCGSHDPDLRMHLMAVLLKLGEDARSISGFTKDSLEGKQGEGQAKILPANDAHRSSGKSEPEPSGEATPSEHSSEEAAMPGTYTEIKEHLLLEDSEELEDLSPVPLTNPAARSEGSSLEHDVDGENVINATGETWAGPSLLIARPMPLSSVQEGDDEVSGSVGASVLGNMGLEDAANTGAATADICENSENRIQKQRKKSISSELSTVLAGLEQHLDQERCSPQSAGSVERSAKWEPLSDGDPSPQLGATKPLSPRASPLGRNSNSWPAALSSLGSASGSELGGDGRDSLQPQGSRSRALQPQQATGSQLSSNTKRRHARNTGAALEYGTGVDQTSRVDGRMDTSVLGVRHSRRQPSQSSSDGSQGTKSDSEGSVVTKRTCFPFAAAIEEEPAAYTDMAHKFEPPSRSTLHEEEQRDSGAASKSSKSPLGSSGEDSTPSPGNTRTPPVKARTPTGSPALFDKGGSVPGSTPLEKATPSREVDVRNPLSQPEFRSHGNINSIVNASRGGMHASPCAESSKCRSPVASWSLAGSAMPTPFLESASPFCEAAATLSSSEFQMASPLGTHSLPSPSDKVSVRILNGVSGEEEVRFPIHVEASFSEQHFYSMLDQLCQKHAGQTLSDMNWLSQAQQGARFQRRECDLTMVEELFSDDTSQRKGAMVLLLCTVPAKPPSELPANKVRLRNIMPCRVHHGTVQPVRLQVDTSILEAGHMYSVAFTHQWTNVTYSIEASLLPNCRGVELNLPWQILTAAGSNTDGLYDVHLVTDGAHRSENRRTLTVGSAESEFSSSSTAMSTAQSSFVPLHRGGANTGKM